MLYRMVSDLYGGAGPYDPDSLDNWKATITSVCRDNGWSEPDWRERGDGIIEDATTGATILEPVDNET